MVDLRGGERRRNGHDIVALMGIHIYVRTYIHPYIRTPPLWYSARNRSVLRRRKAERRTAAVISSRRDWPSRGTRGSVGGQWRSGLGFSRILPPEIRRVLCATYTRARARPRCTRNSDFSNPVHTHIHQGRCPPVAGVHHRRRRSDVQLFRIFHPLPTPRRPRSSLSIRSVLPLSLRTSLQEASPIHATMIQLFLFFLGFRGNSKGWWCDGKGIMEERECDFCSLHTHFEVTRE